MNITFKKTHPGFKYLKSEVLNTILPLSIIKEEARSDSSAKTEMPIFYNVKSEKFCTFLPDQFLTDVNLKEIIRDHYFSSSTITEDNESFLFFSYDSLNELRNATNDEKSTFSLFKNKYENHLVDIKNGNLVIFIAFKNEHSTQIFQAEEGHKLKDLVDSVIGTSSKFEFFQAYKFNNKYYLVDKDGNIDQNSSFDLKKNVTPNMHHLVIPYTDNDWALVNSVYNKITDIKSKIDSIFAQQQQMGLLDKPFSESSHPLLEDFTATKKYKP